MAFFEPYDLESGKTFTRGRHGIVIKDERTADGSDRADDGTHPGGLVRDGMRNRAR